MGLRHARELPAPKLSVNSLFYTVFPKRGIWRSSLSGTRPGATTRHTLFAAPHNESYNAVAVAGEKWAQDGESGSETKKE